MRTAVCRPSQLYVTDGPPHLRTDRHNLVTTTITRELP